MSIIYYKPIWIWKTSSSKLLFTCMMFSPFWEIVFQTNDYWQTPLIFQGLLQNFALFFSFCFSLFPCVSIHHFFIFKFLLAGGFDDILHFLLPKIFSTGGKVFYKLLLNWLFLFLCFSDLLVMLTQRPIQFSVTSPFGHCSQRIKRQRDTDLAINWLMALMAFLQIYFYCKSQAREWDNLPLPSPNSILFFVGRRVKKFVYFVHK